MTTMQLAILGSTRGSAMQPIIDHIERGRLNARINIVISNQPNAFILQRAQQHGLLTHCLPSHDLDRTTYDAQLHALLAPQKIDLIMLIGFMRILGADFTAAWENKIINVHPALLPKHKGLMDLEVHHKVIANNEKKTGCSVHRVTADVDGGDVLIQKTCAVSPLDTAQTLKAKVQALEGNALIDAIQAMQHHRIVS